MHSSQKLSSSNLAIFLFTAAVLSFNNLVAILPASNSSKDLRALEKTAQRGRLQRAVSLSNINEFSSESGSSDGETSDGSSSGKSRLSRASAAISKMFKTTSSVQEAKAAACDASRKLKFFKDRWLAAKTTGRTRATKSVPEISPIIVPSVALVATPDRLLPAPVDLGDAVPSQARTVSMLSLVCTPLVLADNHRKTPAVSPASPIPVAYYRSACLECWFEKTK
jgi:hypothetical protein